MATVLHNFTAGTFGVVYKEPNVSQGVNRLVSGVLPWGVYRGFVLETQNSGMLVKLTADPDTKDHVAAFRLAATGETLTVRKFDGSPNEIPLNLTGLENKTVVVCLLPGYTTNATTTFRVVAYDEASGEWATDKATALPLGVVVVPGSGSIAATAVTPRLRRLAFADVSADLGWAPVVPNPAFDHRNGVVSSTHEVEKLAGWGARVGTTTAYPAQWVFSQQTSGVGGRCLQAAIPATAEDARVFVGSRGGVGDAGVQTLFPCAPGDFLLMVVDALPTSVVNGTASLLVRSFQADGVTVIASHEMVLPTSGAQARTEMCVRLAATAHLDAADARWFTVELKFNGTGTGSGNFRVDNVQVFAQRRRYTDREPLALGSLLAQAITLSAGGADEVQIATSVLGSLLIGPRFSVADMGLILGEAGANKGVILDTYRQILMRRGLAKTVTPAAHEVYANAQIKALVTHVYPGTITDAFNVDTVTLEDSNTTCKVTFKRALADALYQVNLTFEDTVTPANVAWIPNVTEKNAAYFRFKFLKGTDNTQMNMNTILGGFNAKVHGRWVGEI